MTKTQTTLIRTTTSIMNLLDKRTTIKTGLAMLPALFFLLSCEEPSEIGLDLNPNNGAVSTHYIEIPLETSQYYNDSIFSAVIAQSDSRNITPVPIGRHSSPQFGELTASAYTNIGLPRNPGTIAAGVQVDSVFLFLSYSNSFLGEAAGLQQVLNIHRLQDPISPTDSVIRTINGEDFNSLRHQYYIFDQQELGEQLGQISFDTAEVANSTLKIALSQEFAQELLTKVQESDSSFLNNQQAFDAFAGGLAIVPGENNSFINTYNLVLSSMNVYYQQNDTTRTLSFPFTPKGRKGVTYEQFPTYYHLDSDYSNTALANVAEDTRGGQIIETTDNLLYFRTGVGLHPKVSFTALEDFITSDTIGAFVINQAVLEIDSVRALAKTQPLPGQLGFFFTDTNNKRLASVIPGEANAQRYVSNEQDTLYNYRANLVNQLEMYIQSMDDKLLQGMLYPGNAVPFSGFVTEPEEIKLKIYYTSLKED